MALLLLAMTAACLIAAANADALPFSTNGGRKLYLGNDEFVVRGINYSCAGVREQSSVSVPLLSADAVAS